MRKRNVLVCLTAITSALLCAEVFAESEMVSLQQNKKNQTVTVKIGEEVFTVFNLGKDLPKPFASPVNGPGGVAMTRPIPTEGVKVDHKHHKGVWVSIDEVNEIKFWAEAGKIENVKSMIQEGNPPQLTLVNHWLGKDGEPLLEETTKISIFPNRLMAYDITFKALEESVTFDDTKEGLFGIRLIDSLRETETGKVVDSEGRNGTKEAWGKTADWVDYYGQVDGKTVGAAIFDHPDNFRPSRYHVRNYGLFTISPFGEQAYAKQGAKPLTLKPGETLNLKYGIYIHAGDTAQGKVAEAYQAFVKHAGKKEGKANAAIDINKLSPKEQLELKEKIEAQLALKVKEVEALTKVLTYPELISEQQDFLKDQAKRLHADLVEFTKRESQMAADLEALNAKDNIDPKLKKYSTYFYQETKKAKDSIQSLLEENREEQQELKLFSEKADEVERDNELLEDLNFSIRLQKIQNDKDHESLKAEIQSLIDAKTTELADLAAELKLDPMRIDQREKELNEQYELVLQSRTDLLKQRLKAELQNGRDKENNDLAEQFEKENNTLSSKLSDIESEQAKLDRYSLKAEMVRKEIAREQRHLNIMKQKSVE